MCPHFIPQANYPLFILYFANSSNILGANHQQVYSSTYWPNVWSKFGMSIDLDLKS